MKTKILPVLAGIGFIGMANAADMTIYYSPTCPHCHHAQDFTKNNFIYEYPTMKVTLIDVTNPDHRSLFMDALKECNFSSGGVPVIKIGEKCFQGFAEGMADELREAIEIDLADDVKKSAADVKKAIAADGEKYRSEHSTEVATVTEYTITADKADTATDVATNAAADDEKATTSVASDNKLASWILVILALAIFGIGIVASRKSKK